MEGIPLDRPSSQQENMIKVGWDFMDRMENATTSERQTMEMDTHVYVTNLYSLFGYHRWMDPPSNDGSDV